VIGYAERCVFSSRQQEAYRLARALVGRLVDSYVAPPRRSVRCHELARAVARRLVDAGHEARVVDGHLGAIQHSWVILADPIVRDAILDVYVPGRLPQVQLVDGHPFISSAYQVGEVHDVDVLAEEADRLYAEMALPGMVAAGAGLVS
jgi:hypothetical protein